MPRACTDQNLNATVGIVGGDIHVRLADRELTGTFETLDHMGRLMLRLPGGALEAIMVGEVFSPARMLA